MRSSNIWTFSERGWLGYVYSLVFVAVATLLRLALEPVVGAGSIPFITYFLAALLAAWRFGLGAAILCVVASTVFGSYLFLGSPQGVFVLSMRSARATAAGFLGVGVIACYLLAALQTALRRARDAEQQQRRVNEELLRSNRDLQAFAFAASHDLREPLRTVSTYSQLLVQSARDGKLDETNVAAGFIVESTRRMDNLLDDLLAYTQLNTDPQDHAEEPVDLNRVFSATLQNLQTMIVESRAAITCANLPAVNGRESHFIQVFQNLVENAIKYSGDRTPEVHITAQRQGAEWRLAVRDNGMGIDPAYHQHIFEVFKRLHGHKIPGTGVGLAICRRVVERCGGRIWVESQPGSGSVFYFTLPASRQA